METSTPFDLNQAIHKWRNDLAQSPAFRSENLHELETHLRDSIAALSGGGLSDEETFIIATKRLGKSSQLEAEFAKQNSHSVWLDRALWILLGAQLWAVASVLSSSLQTFLQAAIPKANAWLSDYGFGRISESIPGHVFYAIALPVVILAGAKLFSITLHWSESRGWSPSDLVLDRPRLVAGLYGMLCLAPLGIQYGTTLMVRWFALERYTGMSMESGYALFALVALHVAVFTTIVMVVASRRLRLRQN
jgi:hypothetical protein